MASAACEVACVTVMAVAYVVLAVAVWVRVLAGGEQARDCLLGRPAHGGF